MQNEFEITDLGLMKYESGCHPRNDNYTYTNHHNLPQNCTKHIFIDYIHS